MTTQQIADHTGYAYGSVGTILKRKNIAPAYRGTGSSGQYVYPAAAVLREWPHPVGGAPYEGVRFTAQGEPERTTTVEGRWHLADVGPTYWPRGMFTPTLVDLVFVDRHEGKGWSCAATLWGVRVRNDGSPGADDARAYFPPGTPRPAWLEQFIVDNTPTH